MAGPIAEAFVAIKPEFGSFNAELKSSLAKAERVAEGAGEGIEDSFKEAAKQSADEFNRLDKSAFREVISGADRAGEQVEDSFREAARTSERALGGINVKRIAGGLAAAFAGVQIGSFFKDAALDAQRLNSALANTDQILQATGGVAGITADQIRTSSQELSLLTGTAAVDIQEASNVLLTFKNIGTEAFERTQAAALDMGAVLGTDAKGAAVQLGKALNDPTVGVSALGRAGVTFTDQQKEQIKTMQESGDLVGAQTIVLDELESQFKGTAEASADSTAKIGAAFTALKENVGQGLIGALDEVTPVLLDLITQITPALTMLGELLGDAFLALMPTITTLIEGLQPLFDIFAAMIPVIAPVIELIAGIFVTAVETLAAVFVPLLEAIAPVVKIITGKLGQVIQKLAPIFAKLGGIIADVLIRALDIMLPIIEELIPVFAQVATIIGGAVGQALQTLGDAFITILAAVAPLIPLLAGAFLQVFQALAPIIPVLAEVFATLATTLVTALVPVVTQLIELLAPLLVQLIDSLLPVLPQLADLFILLVEAILPILPPLLELIELILPPLVDLLTNILIPILVEVQTIWIEVFTAIIDTTVEVITAIIEWIVDLVENWSENWEEIKAKAAEIWDAIYTNTIGRVTDLYNKVVEWVDKLKGYWDTAWQAVADFVGEIWDGIGLAIDTAWTNIKQFVSDGVDGVVDFVSGIPGRIADGVVGAFDALTDGFKTAVNFIITGWNNIEFKIPGFKIGPVGYDGFTLGLPDIPKLANGAVVTKPTLALIGEAGPEVVSPLGRQRRNFLPGGDGGGAVVSINNANFYDGTDADLVAQKTMLALSARRLTA